MYPLVEPRQRPERFLLNRFSPLAESAALLGLGGFDAAGSVWYPDAMRLLGAVPNDGTLTNMEPETDWIQALGRWACNYGGTNEYAELPLATGDEPLTIACWCSPAALSALMQLVSLGNNGNFGYYGLRVRGDLAGKIFEANKQAEAGSTLGTAAGTTGAVVNAWYHVCGVFASTTLRHIYVNGVLEGSDTTSLGTASVDWGAIAVRRRNIRELYATAAIADVIIAQTAYSSGIISALADPSNVMLEVGGVPLILPPHRVAFPAAVAAGGFKPYWLRRSTQIIGGGIAA